MVEGENGFSQVVLWPFTLWGAHSHGLCSELFSSGWDNSWLRNQSLACTVPWIPQGNGRATATEKGAGSASQPPINGRELFTGSVLFKVERTAPVPPGPGFPVGVGWRFEQLHIANIVFPTWCQVAGNGVPATREDLLSPLVTSQPEATMRSFCLCFCVEGTRDKEQQRPVYCHAGPHFSS